MSDTTEDAMKMFILFFVFSISAFPCVSQLATNAPRDKPAETDAAAYQHAIAPYVTKARATYPGAKKRYLDGLPPRHTFFITTLLHDKSGKWESVFIAVESIKDGTITGTIANDLLAVKEFKPGQKYTFPEKDLLDWTISKPDGSEEGNFVGKFLDTHKP
jgi:hypothetical protein